MPNNGAVGGGVRWGLRGALRQVEVFGVSNWEEDGGGKQSVVRLGADCVTQAECCPVCLGGDHLLFKKKRNFSPKTKWSC